MEPLRVGTEPDRLRFWADVLAFLGFKEGLEISEEVVVVRRSGSVADVVGGIVVHAVEIVGALNESDFFRGECWETVAKLRDHGGGVVTVVNGVGEPGDAEFEFTLSGFDVEGVGRVPGVDAVTCSAVSKIQWKGVREAYHSR